MNEMVPAPASLSGLAEQINEQHQLATDKALSAIGHARQAGELLCQAKDRLDHGQWLPWLEANFPFAPKTAQNYMKIAREWPRLEDKANTNGVSHLPIRDALALLAEPGPSSGEVDDSEAEAEGSPEDAKPGYEEEGEPVARGEREIMAMSKEIRLRKQEERRAERMDRLQQLSEQPFPDGSTRFPVLYADPPWLYQHNEADDRAIENHYETMPLESICSLPVAGCATTDAVLFLWATPPKLAEAVRVIEAWGFVYRSCAVWEKDKIGMGYWWRQQHELLLTAVRGNMPTPAPGNRFASVVKAPRGEHSVKPERFYEIIEAMYPGLPRLELFARNRRIGWEAWGNEVPAVA